MNNLPLITFGFVNCNRLYYLKSCLESFLSCTEDYSNKQIIVVDNASIESGTSEYLEHLKTRGIYVYKQKERDPSNEYAKALNIIVENSIGNVICPLAADMQFVLSPGWLTEYAKFMVNNKDNIGCISFDAQRRVRNNNHNFSNPVGRGDYKFVIVKDKNPIMGAANAMYSKDIIEKMYPWSTNNDSHEGGGDSETKMLIKASKIIKNNKKKIFNISPIIPPSIGIYNEHGDNARVRENRRYGLYSEAKNGVNYYKVQDFNEMLKKSRERKSPFSIEEMAESIGWTLPKDNNGEWIKNPLNIKSATINDYEEIK